MKILYSYRTEEEKNYVAKTLLNHEVVFHEGPLQKGSWSGGGIEVLSVFVDSKVGAKEFEKLPNLKFIACQSTGYDHIDQELAREKKVAISNVPAYGEHTVAEFAFALLLALSRKIIEANKRVEEDGYFNPDGLTGFDLFGKTIGILGTGRIGKNAIKIAKGFGMNVLAFDSYPQENFSKEFGFSYKPIEEILRTADIISLHLPANKETDRIINKERVSQMKKGMVIINTARGSLIDTESLVWGLEQQIISAAGLDVLSEETNVNDEFQLLSDPEARDENMKILLMNHYLIAHPRVLITPHTAFNTKESTQRIIDTSIENINKFAAGSPQNVIS